VNKVFLFGFVPLLIVFFWGCGNENHGPGKLNLTPLPREVVRLDVDLFSFDPANPYESLNQLREKYGDAVDGYIEVIITRRPVPDSLVVQSIISFLETQSVRDIFGEVKQVYPDVKNFEQGIAEMCAYWKHYFPGRTLPTPVTMISGLNLPTANFDSSIFISLDLYLGQGNKIYDFAGIERYRRKTMTPFHLLPDFTRAWLYSQFPDDPEEADLLSEMVYQGKILYLLDCLLPGVHDTLKIGYTEKQLGWCRQNEANMWSFFIKDNLLFSKDFQKIGRFTGESPFTSGFNKQSPGRTGVWIGWQMVRKLMKDNPEITPEELMQNFPAQKVLSKSKYKPR
jgi:hypothetical protein